MNEATLMRNLQLHALLVEFNSFDSECKETQCMSSVSTALQIMLSKLC